MKISAKDEYGLRILLRIAQESDDEGISISKLSEAEGISEPYVAKIARMLRLSGFIQSTRGNRGGYVLAREAGIIKINEVLHALDGKLFDDKFCGSHSGTQQHCSNSVDCSVRSLWKMLQHRIDEILDNITLQDLLVKQPLDSPAHLLLQRGIPSQALRNDGATTRSFDPAS